MLFACKLCSFTGANNNKAGPAATPTVQPMLYANDLIKQQLGNFSLVTHSTKEQMRKTASASGTQLLNQASDAGVGEYRSEKGKTVLLTLYSFSTPQAASNLVDQMERDGRDAKSKSTILKTTQTANGKRLEAIGVVERKVKSMVIWSNGYWFFMTIGDSMTDATALADAVGY